MTNLLREIDKAFQNEYKTYLIKRRVVRYESYAYGLMLTCRYLKEWQGHATAFNGSNSFFVRKNLLLV
jgi:hypothetical protein